MRLTKLLVVVAGFVLVGGSAGCSDDDGGPESQLGSLDASGDGPGDGASSDGAGDGSGDGAGTGFAMIGAPGGRVSSADGVLTLEFPRGALTQPVMITVGPAAMAAAGTLGAAYDVAPRGLRPAKPVRIIFNPPATAGDGGAGASAGVAAAFDGNHWIPLAAAKPDGTSGAKVGSASVLGSFALVPGFCSACTTTCDPAACHFGPDNSVAGKCAMYGNGCSRCVPTCDGDGDGFCPGHPAQELPGGDCDDSTSLVSPGALEVCGNRIDDDCDGQIDEGCTPCTGDGDCSAGLQACINGFCDVCETGCNPATCAFGDGAAAVLGRCQEFGKGCSRCVPACDKDGDGYCAGDPGNHQKGGDCDDSNPNVHPDGVEVCGNGIDDDCNGAIDELCASCTSNADCKASQGCRDGTCATCSAACTADTCRFGVTETDKGVPGKCVPFGNGCNVCVPVCDGDGDGFCPGGPGNGQPGGDCRDNDPAVRPGAVEVCGNGVDDNCDGHVDEGCTVCARDAECPQGFEACIDGVCNVCPRDCDPATCRFGVKDQMPGSGVAGRCFPYGGGCTRCVPTCDQDGDGFCPGQPGNDQLGGDCNDQDPAIKPTALEICGNKIDDNCDGRIDEGCATCAQANTCAMMESCSTGR
jgi:hypothetical protein